MYVTETGCRGLDCIQVAQTRVQWLNTCEHGTEPSRSIKDGEFSD